MTLMAFWHFQKFEKHEKHYQIAKIFADSFSTDPIYQKNMKNKKSETKNILVKNAKF